MLLELLRKLAGAPRHEPVPDEGLLEHATDLMLRGDRRAAIAAYRDYLADDPYNLRVLNDLGTCLADTGDLAGASALFELAHSLDDTFIPAMVNHAKLLVDRNDGEQAMEYLRRAKTCFPTFLHTDNVYAGLLMRQGEPALADRYQLKSWLADFDNLRSANSHLFWSTYFETDQQKLAAEHRFWAETLRPVSPPMPAGAETPTGPWQPSCEPHAGRRIRIGYWSADFRNHSVRYFFRPLLEGHDTSRFEIFLYYDAPVEDAQTDLIRQRAEHFLTVQHMVDLELRDLIRSHDLDLLVDLAGHTSHNRLSLLQERMARLQVNAIGYPPTTGLRSVDYKLLDRHCVTEDAGQLYAEKPMVLPGSFWCFDPMEEAKVAPEPPMVANGFVTFGCVGNVSKITEDVAKAWIRILVAVPGSRLVLRSVTFEEPLAVAATRERLGGWGLPLARMEFLQPSGGADFLTSYNAIDIILDTYPFNGGTTTAFATYMGVPVVSITGNSLVNRMGLSMMAQFGAEHLAVRDTAAYVEAATRLAGDAGFLRAFRGRAREVYGSTPLGNGKLFAREFEAACVAALEDIGRENPADRPDTLAVLPAREIMRRAYAVMRASQPDAAQRVLAHCLRHYPDAAAAHLLHAQTIVWAGRVDEAAAYVLEKMDRFDPAERPSAWISLARMYLLQDDAVQARNALEQLRGLEVDDEFDREQAALYEASVSHDCAAAAETKALPPVRMRLLVSCDDHGRFEAVAAQLRAVCELPAGWSWRFDRVGESSRAAAYAQALADADADLLVFLQKNVEIHQRGFLRHLADALAESDVVSCAGARRWSRLDWRADGFEHKAGGFLSPSSERRHHHEVHVLGGGAKAIVPGMAILDGAVLALRPSALRAAAPFDEEMLGCEALMEEHWVHGLGQAGVRLAVHRNLGVLLTPSVDLDAGNRVEARMHCAAKMAFEPFEHLDEDHSSLSVPVRTPAEGVATLARYLRAA
jgi:predicted O-linked N-acetylglucosamine transferase (SPINDLY family)